MLSWGPQGFPDGLSIPATWSTQAGRTVGQTSPLNYR